ncbi:hypothetical protein EOM39_06915, partial [Candidatus Gracilibacteria bacterium]|nr:hypothetical protein [Candidatus Gracilibacteria bacterium]
KIQQEYVNNKGVTKIRTIREEYTETNTYYYEKDEKGSITKITDKDGTTIEQYLYDAYGIPYTKTQSGELVTISNLKPSLIGNTRLYTGREYDRGLQLYYNRARYYNPQLSRFISRDPIDISDDVNLYTYVGNNPINYIDQSGTEKKWIKENEGNAWYFDEVTTDNIVGHAGLYFIYGGKDYLLSFYPNTNGNVGSSQTEDIFFGVQNSKNDNESIEKIRLDLFLNKKNMYNYIELGNENINSTGLYNRYKKETSNLPGYNTFVNNCSSEVRRGLVAAGFLVDREEALKESINDNLSLTSGYVDNLKLLYNAGSTIIPDTPLTLREEINKQLIKNNLFGN